MVKSYGDDLKKSAVELHVELGKPLREISEALDVPVSTLGEWVSRYRNEVSNQNNEEAEKGAEGDTKGDLPTEPEIRQISDRLSQAVGAALARGASPSELSALASVAQKLESLRQQIGRRRAGGAGSADDAATEKAKRFCALFLLEAGAWLYDYLKGGEIHGFRQSAEEVVSSFDCHMKLWAEFKSQSYLDAGQEGVEVLESEIAQRRAAWPEIAERAKAEEELAEIRRNALPRFDSVASHESFLIQEKKMDGTAARAEAECVVAQDLKRCKDFCRERGLRLEGDPQKGWRVLRIADGVMVAASDGLEDRRESRYGFREGAKAVEVQGKDADAPTAIVGDVAGSVGGVLEGEKG